MNFLFLGRIHPIVVHLPIGFIIMAIILEILSKKRIINGQEHSIVYTLFFGTLTGIFSVIFGWILAETSAYNNQILLLHRWFGIITTILSAIAWWGKNNSKTKIYNFVLIWLGISLLVTGHLGGTLTHGQGYLNFAAINKNKGSTEELPSQPDSIIVYEHLIKPIFQSKCYNCHNDQINNGGLDLTNLEYLKDGLTSKHNSNNDFLDSEIFFRITLPQFHEKFMPKNGEQLTYGEISLIKWWIGNGADLYGELMKYDISAEMKYILMRDYNLNLVERPFVEKFKIDSISSVKLNSLRTMGWEINPLAQNNNFLDISIAEGYKIKSGQIAELNEIKDNITWLNLANQGIKDIDLTIVSKFHNLTRLRIENNNISDKGVKHLVHLKNLISLNIYNNPISDNSLEYFEQLQNLKKIFIWKTNITSIGIEKLKFARSDLHIIAGNL